MHAPQRIETPGRFAAAIAALLWIACAAPPPPPPAPEPAPAAAMDLSRVGRLGVLHFSAVGETALEPAARRDFLAAVRAAQPGAALVELGAVSRVLESVGRKALDAEAIRAIGRKHGVSALLVGELWADTIDPVEFMQRARSGAGEVEIEGTLSARIFETRQGAQIWSASALGKQPITRVRVNAWGSKSVDAGHLQQVRLELLEDLVAQATVDFEPAPPLPLAGSEPARQPAVLPVPAKAAGRD